VALAPGGMVTPVLVLHATLGAKRNLVKEDLMV
jgi:hypothetical protein